MPTIAPIPESPQGGGSTVTEQEVAEIAALLREHPSESVRADDRDAFARKTGEKKSRQARSRTGSAADRMRQRVAVALELDEDAATAAVRAVESDAKGQPIRYAYWIALKPSAVESLQGEEPSAVESLQGEEN